mmetsp:Transcript_22935/g.57429  ORF Transcript_22935/g.57429 Transcript_22935/m.57429 type:complete len:241 (-) Transcript_22935:494-1216(-)
MRTDNKIRMSQPHTASMWDLATDCIVATENHPFLMSMLDGSLAMPNFQYYILQDSHYLKHFAAALRLLAEKDNFSEEEKAALRGFADGADFAERGLHDSFFKSWHKSVSDVSPCPNNLLYTSYLTSVVATEGYAEGLAVLLPCFWVYMHVGQRLLASRQASTAKRAEEFDRWIDMYGGEEFGVAVKAYRALVEKAAGESDEATRKRMGEHFVKCCDLEWMFWAAAVDMQQWPAYPKAPKP